MQRVELSNFPSVWHIFIIELYKASFYLFSIPLPLFHHSNVCDVYPFYFAYDLIQQCVCVHVFYVTCTALGSRPSTFSDFFFHAALVLRSTHVAVCKSSVVLTAKRYSRLYFHHGLLITPPHPRNANGGISNAPLLQMS